MGAPAGVERELKFACPDLSALREKLVEASAERVAPASLEDNLIYDRAREVRDADCLLRLRRDGTGASLTFKGPATFEGGVKVREERESRVSDPDAVERILEALGYEVVRRYQKRREQWEVGGVVVALDRTPIGDFAEFEGDGAEKLATRFGFSPEKAERSNYLDLYSRYRKDHPGAPEDMVFPA